MEWREDAAAAWEADGVQVGVVREVDDVLGQPPPITRSCFQRWMLHARGEAAAGDAGYAIGRRALDLLAGEADDPDFDVWNLVRRVVADVFGHSVFRVASSLPQEVLAVALCARGVLDLGLPQDQSAQDILQVLRTLDTDACPSELIVFRAEVDAVMLELSEEEADVVHAGATAAAEPADDVGIRESVVDSLAAAAQEVLGDIGAGSVSDSAAQSLHGAAQSLKAQHPLPLSPIDRRVTNTPEWILQMWRTRLARQSAKTPQGT